MFGPDRALSFLFIVQFRFEDVLVEPQVKLLPEKLAGVLVDEVVHLALALEEVEGTF